MEFKTEPYEHQLEEYEEYWDDPARALLWQMRTGKSKAVIDSIARNFIEDKIDGVFIIAPNGVHDNWIRREFPKHCPIGWEGNAWVSNAKKKKKHDERILSIIKGIRSRRFLGVIAVNVESLLIKKVQQLAGSMVTGSRIALIVDESHKFSNPSAKRTKRLLTMVHHFPWRRILTGTPTGNSPLKIFSQFEILKPSALGFQKYNQFKRRYADFEQGLNRKTNRYYEQITGYKNQEELQIKISDFASVVLRSDCEDLPDIMNMRRYIIMSKTQTEAYRTMAKQYMVELEDGDIVETTEVTVRLIRMQQILSNFIVKETGEIAIIDEKKNSRIDALVDIVEESSDKIIVWCRYREELRQLEEKFGKISVSYHGGVKPKDRVKAMNRFEKDPSCKLFLGQPACAGEGLDLSAADTIVWFSHSFDVTVRDQASERATKTGKKSIAVIDFVTPDSVDEYILENLEKKQEISKKLTGLELKKLLDLM